MEKYQLPSLEKCKANKERYLNIIEEVCNYLEITEDKNYYEQVYGIFQKMPLVHQIIGKYNLEAVASFKAVYQDGLLKTNASLNPSQTGMMLEIDKDYKLDEVIYYTLGRPMYNYANDSIIFLFPQNHFSLEYPNAYFSNDIMRVAEKLYPEQTIYNDWLEGFPKEVKQPIWENYCETILTIEDGIEVLARFVALRTKDLHSYFTIGNHPQRV